jgi:hypothetical protein
MPRQTTQADIVKTDQGYVPKTLSEKIKIPGIENLHEKPTDEIAEVLATVLRSRSNVQEVRYVLGEYIELVTLNR